MSQNLISMAYRKIAQKSVSLGSADRNMLFFAYEGILIALINTIVNNNNNLFATRLGATDFQLSLVATLPQFVGMLVLIPGGILTDRMTNKRRMVILSLIILAGFYAAIGFVPIFGSFRLLAFLVLLALSVGPMTLYNTSWQAYFSDVVPELDRNRTFTLRTKWTFLVNFSVPLLTGFLLASVSTNVAKIRFHQIFFWTCSLLILVQILVLNKITGGTVHAQSRLSLTDLKSAAKDLAHNKKFLGFVGVAIFFYLTWQTDWTLYYLAQVNYLKMNEAWLSYAAVGGSAIQFVTVGFWSRINEKHGVRFPIIIGSFALAFFPLIVIISTSLPLSIGPIVFVILHTLFNFAFATVTLNILQCLLQVIPEKNKTLSISLYTVLVSFSNAVMPMAGVKLYTALGANLHALHLTFFIIFVLRIVATGLWILRWWLLRNRPK